VQATTGSAGWPLSVFLTPQRVPFFGGTYFGKESTSAQRPTFQSVLHMVADRWQNDAQSLLQMGLGTIEHLRRASEVPVAGSSRAGDVARMRAVHKTFMHLRQSFDGQYGGFGAGAKFAMPSALSMLLSYSILWKELAKSRTAPPLSELRRLAETLHRPIPTTTTHDDHATTKALWSDILEAGQTFATEAADMVHTTLMALANGGIHDHVAGGFHRYSVDRAWSLPHFEKMLYDQAQLIKVFCESWAARGRPVDSPFMGVVRRTIAYCNEALLDGESGGYYAAEDADGFDASTGRVGEGFWATWTDAEVNQVLREAQWSDQQLKLFKYHFTILPRGNVRGAGAHDPLLLDKNVLVVRNPIEVSASKTGFAVADARALIARGLRLLKERRGLRPRPHRDEKIIASWNGLMLSALATSARILHDQEYLLSAERLAQFIVGRLVVKQQHDNAPLWVLKRFMIDGSVVEDLDGFASDYAMVIAGLLDLHQASLKDEYLVAAEALQHSLDVLFRDKANFGYFSASRFPLREHDEPLIATKDDSDGVEPSANSLAAWNCLRLHLLSGKKGYSERFKQILRLFTRHLDSEPQSMTALVSALIVDIMKPKLLVLNRHPSDDELAAQVFHVVRADFAPNILVTVTTQDDGKAFEGHVCQGTSCSAPTSSISSILKDQLCL